MSLQRHLLTCTHCPTRSELLVVNKAEAKKKAESTGWTFVEGRWLCPKCSAKKEQ